MSSNLKIDIKMLGNNKGNWDFKDIKFRKFTFSIEFHMFDFHYITLQTILNLIYKMFS